MRQAVVGNVQRLKGRVLLEAAPLRVLRWRHDNDEPLHDHDFMEVVLILGGRAIHRTAQGDALIQGGDVLVIQPGRWHAYLDPKGLDVANLCLDAGLLVGELAWMSRDPRLAALLLPMRGGPTGSHGILRLRPPSDAFAAAWQLVQALAGCAASSQDRSLAIARCSLVLAELAHAVPPSLVSMISPPPGINAVVEAMAAQPERPWDLAQLSRIAGCGHSVLVRRFRRLTGTTPLAWLRCARLDQAALLLLTTALPVTAIAARVGWGDPDVFARRFRARYGAAPMAWRRRCPAQA